jgi:hypothetical protein
MDGSSTRTLAPHCGTSKVVKGGVGNDVDDCLVLAHDPQLHPIQMENPTFPILTGMVTQPNACSRLIWMTANIKDTSQSFSK